MLSCDVGGGVGYVIGSAKSVDCVFTSTRGTTDRYTGTIRKMGVDLGFYHAGPDRLGRLRPYRRLSPRLARRALSGRNRRGHGVCRRRRQCAGRWNRRSIQQQTVSIGGQLGLNLAATGTSVTLTRLAEAGRSEMGMRLPVSCPFLFFSSALRALCPNGCADRYAGRRSVAKS